MDDHKFTLSAQAPEQFVEFYIKNASVRVQKQHIRIINRPINKAKR